MEIRCADLDRLQEELAETGRITLNSRKVHGEAKLLIARNLGPVALSDLISEPASPLFQVVDDSKYQQLIWEARLEADKSPCWLTKVGCLITEDDQIIARDHNKPVLKGTFCQRLEGVVDPEEVRSLLNPGEALNFCQTIHDVESAVASAARDGRAIGNKTWFLSLEPCDRCANTLVVIEPQAVYFSLGIGRERYYNSIGLERLVQAGIPTYFVKMPEENGQETVS